MKNKKVTTENAIENTAEKTVEKAAETEAIEQVSGRKKIYKDQDFYPVCAIIMCICAVLGDLIARYIFKGSFDGLAIGMIVGVVCAIIYIKKGGKQLDTSPTKERTKKQK